MPHLAAFGWQIGREVLDTAGRAIRAGVTTDEIDRVVSGEGCFRFAIQLEELQQAEALYAAVLAHYSWAWKRPKELSAFGSGWQRQQQG